MIKNLIMTYNTAKNISYIIHRIILTALNIGPGIYFGTQYGGTGYFLWFVTFMTIWIISIFIFKGCIFTQIENIIALKVYQKPFYPEYDITKSIPYEFYQKIRFQWKTRSK